MIEHSPSMEKRLFWDPFRDDTVVIKGQVWKGKGRLLLKEKETIVPNSMRIIPYWLFQSEVLTPVMRGEQIAATNLLPVSLENYLCGDFLKKKTPQKKITHGFSRFRKNDSQRPIFRKDQVFTHFKDDDGYVDFDVSCIFDVQNRDILYNDEKHCPPGALSLCLEVIVRDSQSGCDVLYRAFSNGFTVAKSMKTSLQSSISAPPSEQILIRSSKPGILPVKQHKRVIDGLSSGPAKKELPISRSGNSRLFEFRFLGHQGTVHSFRSESHIDLYFSAPLSSSVGFPCDHISLSHASGIEDW